MYLKYNEVSIFCETFGQGPAIVLLHGFLESSTMWESLVSTISENYTVVILDFPGLGKSGVISEIHSMELMADVVISVLEHLKIDRATFIGHSMGGYVMLALTEKYEDKVEKLVFLNSSSFADSEERKEIRDRAVRLVEKNSKAFIRMAIGNWAGENSRKVFASEIENLKNQAYSFSVKGITAALKGMRDRKDRTDVLANFSGPKYMLLAEDDPIIPLYKNLELAKKSEVVTEVISGGHMSTIENKAALENFVCSILKI